MQTLFSVVIFVAIGMSQPAFSTFLIERTKERYGRRANAPFLTEDSFQNPSGCSIFASGACSRSGGYCDGIISCCFCKCNRLRTFTSLSTGCTEGTEYRKALTHLGIQCDFFSVEIPSGVPSFASISEFKKGLKFSLLEGKTSINLGSTTTSCFGLGLYYINRNGNEVFVTDNRCSGIFKVVRIQSSSKYEWYIKWVSTDEELWKSLGGRLLKFDIRCVNQNNSNTFISCINIKIVGGYDDEKELASYSDTDCPVTSKPPDIITTATLKKTVPIALTLAPSNKSSRSLVPITGGAVGVLLLIVIVILTVCIIRRRKKHNSSSNWEMHYHRPRTDDINRGKDDDDGEYAVIAEGACALDSTKDNEPIYEEATNPYYCPSTGCGFTTPTNPENEKENLQYESSQDQDAQFNNTPSEPPRYENPSALCLPPPSVVHEPVIYEPVEEYEKIGLVS